MTSRWHSDTRESDEEYELRSPYCPHCESPGKTIAIFYNKYMAEQAAKLLKEAWRICRDEPF